LILVFFICTGFQLAVGSIVTSSNSVLCKLVSMPQMYWSISKPSSNAGLLKIQAQTNYNSSTEVEYSVCYSFPAIAPLHKSIL